MATWPATVRRCQRRHALRHHHRGSRGRGADVVELPPGPFIGFVDDHNMRWVQDMGTIGPEKGQGGKHVIFPPDYTGPVPEGYYAGRSKTRK